MSQATPRPSTDATGTRSEGIAEEEPRTREGFARGYARHAPRLYRYFWFHTRSRLLAEDLVSETFVGALSTLDTYRPEEGSFGAWIFGIGKRVLARYSEDQALRALCASDLACQAAQLAEDPVAGAEQRVDLWRAVGELSAQERDVVALKFGAGLMHGEIAEITGLREARVGVLLYRALLRLWARLNGEDSSDA